MIPSSHGASEALVRRHRLLNVAFFLVVAVMLFHESEHVAQVFQKDMRGEACPNDCRGLLGFAFDVEWIHFAYNLAILVLLAALFVGYRMWQPAWRRAKPGAWLSLAVGIFVIQGYHALEHSVKLEQWFGNGHRSPTPGLLGQPLPMAEGRNFSLIELHFLLNTVVLVCVLGGYMGFGIHRHIWTGRPRLGLALAGATVSLFLVILAVGFSFRPPTVHLEAGIHQGPLVLDRAQTLVGEPGATVTGGIRVLSDHVTVRDVKVVGGEYGIEVDGAEDVVLQNVDVSGAVLDGIHVRRSNVVIRHCTISAMRSAHGQGIDISFGFDLRPSHIRNCTVRGGMEGIVSHFAHVRVEGNRVAGTSLRGITVTEMSMGAIEGNDVSGSLGIGIFCGDYSHCSINENTVRGTRPDVSSGDKSRLGFGIVSHYGATAQVGSNAISGSPGGVGAFIGARIEDG